MFLLDQHQEAVSIQQIKSERQDEPKSTLWTHLLKFCRKFCKIFYKILFYLLQDGTMGKRNMKLVIPRIDHSCNFLHGGQFQISEYQNVTVIMYPGLTSPVTRVPNCPELPVTHYSGQRAASQRVSHTV